MPPRAVAALGLGQLINWGALYYAFAVLLPPVQSDLGVAPWVVTGAFSLALLVSALLAPAIGRWSDRGAGGIAIVGGSLAGAALLAGWPLLSGVPGLYLTWTGLGVCMATALYEPAFALLTRVPVAAEVRLRALATVTLYGGLASTVFLPLMALLVRQWGWRTATGVMAASLVGSAALTAYAVRRLPATHPAPVSAAGVVDPPPRFFRVTLALGVASLASASFIANLIPSLGERGIQPATAALFGGLFGVMQLPGRALLVSHRLTLSGPAMLTASLGLQAGGLWLVAVGPTAPLVAAGVMIFAVGAGLTTLARPHLVQSLVGIDRAGAVNGRLARVQQLTRAVGPFAVSVIAARTSHRVVLVVLGAVLATSALVVGEVRRSKGAPPPGAVGR